MRWTFEAKVVSEKRIRDASGDVLKRPVVELEVCLSGQRRKELFALGSRSAMNYRVILGRRALAGRGLVVDVAKKFTTQPGCP